MIVKRGHRSNHRPPVKHNYKAIVISILLATIGVISAVYLYQYTHTAKLEQQYNQVQIELENKSNQLDGTVHDKVQLENQVQELNKVKEDLEKQLQAKAAEKARIAQIQRAQAEAAPKVVTNATPTIKASSTGCDGLRAKLSSLGVLGANLDAAITLAKRESSCNEYAVNSSSGACGAFQSLPCGKWGAPGTNQYYLGAINYANSRYGSYVNALNFSYANNWY